MKITLENECRAALLKACQAGAFDPNGGEVWITLEDAAEYMAQVAREAFRLGGTYYPPMDDIRLLLALKPKEQKT